MPDAEPRLVRAKPSRERAGHDAPVGPRRAPMPAATTRCGATSTSSAICPNIPRAGTPEEVAQGIVFLIKNDFATGTTVDVDGGVLLG